MRVRWRGGRWWAGRQYVEPPELLAASIRETPVDRKLPSFSLSLAIVLLPLAPVGVWIGVMMARRISPVVFYRVLYLGMFLTGCKLLWDGLR